MAASTLTITPTNPTTCSNGSIVIDLDSTFTMRYSINGSVESSDITTFPHTINNLTSGSHSLTVFVEDKVPTVPVIDKVTTTVTLTSSMVLSWTAFWFWMAVIVIIAVLLVFVASAWKRRSA